jgi:hypothetical protein
MILGELFHAAALIVFPLLVFVVVDGSGLALAASEWKLTFYTSDELSDSELKIELIGTNGDSGQITLKPCALKVHVFSLGNLGGRDLGTLKSIIVEKKRSYSIYKDWELIKAQVILLFLLDILKFTRITRFFGYFGNY